MMKIEYCFMTALICIITLFSCAPNTQTTETKEVDELPWHKDAVMYELNVRQFSPEGTFQAVIPELQRIKDLGADILWLMPIHPIGIENRKGSLGSYYSISDYTEINPEFGTKEDFRILVNEAHKIGMKVILDLVANHTAWDHSWVKAYPEWYLADSLGNRPTVPYDNDGNPTDWTDVAGLDYSNTTMRKAMIEDMKYWISEFDIDGYRCDVAGFIPVDFWQEAKIALDSIKPVFMLAEHEHEDYHNDAFHATYGWEFHHYLNKIAQGEKKLNSLVEYMEKELKRFPKTAYRLNFVDNHDENTWNGTVEERMGASADNMTVLAYTLFGMPLIYNGQEEPLNKRLAFFDKDQIDWDGYQKQNFIKSLTQLKKDNPSLWNGEYGSTPVFIPQDSEDIIAYYRGDENNTVLVVVNERDEANSLKIDFPFEGEWVDFDSAQVVELVEGKIEVPTKGYKIFIYNGDLSK